jgi:hypothetical protein
MCPHVLALAIIRCDWCVYNRNMFRYFVIEGYSVSHKQDNKMTQYTYTLFQDLDAQELERIKYVLNAPIYKLPGNLDLQNEFVRCYTHKNADIFRHVVLPLIREARYLESGSCKHLGCINYTPEVYFNYETCYETFWSDFADVLESDIRC